MTSDLSSLRIEKSLDLKKTLFIVSSKSGSTTEPVMFHRYFYDRVKQALRMETGRPNALREAIYHVRKGGTVSVPGVYGGFIDKVPFGSVMNRSLTIRHWRSSSRHTVLRCAH